MNDAQTIPLSVLLDAVAAMQAIKEADAARGFTLPIPMYMRLIGAATKLAYYTDQIVAERRVKVEA